MSPLPTLLWAKARMARHLLASVGRESKLKVGFVSVSAVLLWIGLFAFAKVILRLFEDFGSELLGAGGLHVSDLVVARLLSVFALTLFVMLVFSNVLIAFTTFYRAREVSCLVHSPIPPSAFFADRFVECVTFSSWASAYLGSPALLAYGLETGAPASFYVSLIFFYLPFVTIPAALGTLITLSLVRLLARVRLGRGVAIVGLLAVGMTFAYFRGSLRAPDLSDARTLQAVVETMGRSQSPLLPSHWLSRGVLAAAAGETAEAGFYLLLLAANAALAAWLAFHASRAWFFAGWTALADGEGRSEDAEAAGRGRLERWLRALPEPTRSLVSKDVKLFWRDPAQWSQFVLFFGVMALYVANLRGAHTFTAQWRAWGTLLNMSACMLILASLTTRFVFPLISLEGRRFWILGLSPVGMRRIVWQKFLLSVASTSVFTLGLAILSAVQLELDRTSFLLSVAGIVATTVALSGLAVGLGSLYPNFEEDNPARVVSGMGGTLSFLLSMVYIVLISVAQAAVLFRGAAGVDWVVPAAVVWILAWTAFTCWLPMRLGLRHLERVEF